MSDDPQAVTDVDAQAASTAVADFWTALSEDDDAAVIAATSSAAHEELGTGAGLCGRLREVLGATQEICARVGVSSKVRVIGGVPVFMCLDVGPEMKPKLLGSWGREQVSGWALSTIVERGRWVVEGPYPMDPNGWPDGTQYLDLPHAPPPAGPIQ